MKSVAYAVGLSDGIPIVPKGSMSIHKGCNLPLAAAQTLGSMRRKISIVDGRKPFWRKARSMPRLPRIIFRRLRVLSPPSRIITKKRGIY